MRLRGRAMTLRHFLQSVAAGAAACLFAFTAVPTPTNAGVAKPVVAGQQVRFPDGTWSALPQLGPDGKVRQCVLVAMRQRTGDRGPIETRFSLVISRGAGLAVIIADDALPSEVVFD